MNTDYKSYSLDELSELLQSHMHNKHFFRKGLYQIISDGEITEDSYGMNLRRQSYDNCVFQRTNLEQAGLVDSYFNICKFNNINAMGANMSHSIYRDCVFETDLFGTNFDNSLFYNCKFHGYTLENCIFTNVKFSNCEFIDCTFNSLSFENATFTDNTILDGVKLNRLNFEGVYWENINLKNIRLPFPTIPYIIGGLNCIAKLLNTDNNVFITSHKEKSWGKITLKEYMDLLPAIKEYYLKLEEISDTNGTTDYFPLANIFEFQSDIENAYKCVLKGIKFSIFNKHYHMIHYFCKMVQLSDKFTNHQKSNLFQQILTFVSSFTDEKINEQELSKYLISAKETLLSTNEKPYATVIFDTDINGNDFESIKSFIKIIDDSANKAFPNNGIRYHTELRHNSPVSIALTAFSNPDTVKQMLEFIIAAMGLTASTLNMVNAIKSFGKVASIKKEKSKSSDKNDTNINISNEFNECNFSECNIYICYFNKK